MVINERVGQHIKHLRKLAGIKSQAQLAELCGWKSQSRVGNYEAGTRSVSAADAEVLAKALGVTPAEIMFGKPTEKTTTARVESNAELAGGFEVWDSDTPLGEDEVEIPFYMDVELAAGAGVADNCREYYGPKLRFAKSTLRKQGVSASNAACVKVSGNSMEPVLPHGSTVGVDTAYTEILDGKMYAINHDGMLRVKMLYKLPGGGMRLRSYNTDEWPDEHISIEQLKHIKIIGKVFWYSVLI